MNNFLIMINLINFKHLKKMKMKKNKNKRIIVGFINIMKKLLIIYSWSL